MKKENKIEFFVLKISLTDRKWLIDFVGKGQGEFVAGYLLGRLFQEGEIIEGEKE